MAHELPYLPSYKNVVLLFSKIAGAKQPDTFTTRFLSDTLGLKSPGDRPFIALLKTLGYLDAGGRPTPTYAALKNPAQAPFAIAEATRKAYEPLFAANEKAHDLSQSDLNGLISQVAGTDSNMTTKIAGTLRALIKAGNYSARRPSAEKDKGDGEKSDAADAAKTIKHHGTTEFHYNIQVHLPTNATEETYLNIFNALRKVFRQ
jgi:hypothetical protein